MHSKTLETRLPAHPAPQWLVQWRALASLLAALIILAVMMFSGLFGHAVDGGVDWSHVAVYLCGVVVVALQADRLFHRIR